MNRCLLFAAIFVAPIATTAHAETQGARQAQRDWKAEDQCGKRAFEINNDYTKDAISWRDRFIKDCRMHRRQQVPSTSAPMIAPPPPR